MNVSIVGSGNVAWHLAPALDNTDFAVREVFSRNPRNAEALVERLYHAEVRTSLDFSSSSSDVFVIAVSDDAIPQVVSEIRVPNEAVLVHTSGSQPLSVLEGAASHIGVFYPLQTFTKGKKIDFAQVPIFLESSDRATATTLTKMTRAISGAVHQVTSSQRLALHIAAVFASNFTNHMVTLAHDVLRSNKLDSELMKPLIAETINKALALGPEAAQTGPASRGDLETLDRHYDFLQNDAELAEVYRIISQHIVDRYE